MGSMKASAILGAIDPGGLGTGIAKAVEGEDSTDEPGRVQMGAEGDRDRRSSATGQMSEIASTLAPQNIVGGILKMAMGLLGKGEGGGGAGAGGASMFA